VLQFSHKVKYITQVLFYARFIVLRVVYAVTDVVYRSVMLYMSLFLFSVAARTHIYLNIDLSIPMNPHHRQLK